MTRVILGGLLMLTLGGCWAEGQSFFLGESDPERFITMGACEDIATSKWSDGRSRYTNYVCRFKLVGLTVSTRWYEEGKRERAAAAASDPVLDSLWAETVESK